MTVVPAAVYGAPPVIAFLRAYAHKAAYPAGLFPLPEPLRKKMMEIIEDMGNMSVKAITFSGGGEPLTYPYIDEAVKKIKEKNNRIKIILITQQTNDAVKVYKKINK